MNRHLGLYLWKEWRDQRAGLARLGAVLVLLALCALLLPKAVAGDPLFATSFVGTALVACMLSVGSDLLAGELARDRVRFLERLPGGLSAAFAGKLVLFVAAVLATLLLAFALALGVALLRTGELPLWRVRYTPVQLLVAGSAVFVWTFAVSTWVPRSALALPVSLAVLALLSWPLWLVFGPAPWYAPADSEVPVYVALCLAGAMLSAWASFALGYRRGGGPRRALLAGLGVAVLALSPAWSWTGMRARSLLTLDPGAPDFRIGHAVVGAEERFLFATCYREMPYRLRVDGNPAEPPCFVVIVDLARGSWESQSRAELAYDAGSLGFGPRVVPVRKAGGDGVLLDARTGEAIRVAPKRLELGALPSAAELGLAGDQAVLRRMGLGYQVSSGIFDPFRGRVFASAEVRGPGGDLLRHLVRECDWIARPKLMAKDAAWVRLDPETGKTHAIAGLGPGERVIDVVPDGRLVVSGGAGGAALLDPESGERVQLALEGAPLASDDLIVLATSPIDPLVFRVSAGWQWLARLDPERAVLRPAMGAAGALLYDLGGPDADTSYAVEDDRRIVRVRFGTGEREVVFPRPDSD